MQRVNSMKGSSVHGAAKPKVVGCNLEFKKPSPSAHKLKPVIPPPHPTTGLGPAAIIRQKMKQGQSLVPSPKRHSLSLGGDSNTEINNTVDTSTGMVRLPRDFGLIPEERKQGDCVALTKITLGRIEQDSKQHQNKIAKPPLRDLLPYRGKKDFKTKPSSPQSMSLSNRPSSLTPNKADLNLNPCDQLPPFPVRELKNLKLQKPKSSSSSTTAGQTHSKWTLTASSLFSSSSSLNSANRTRFYTDFSARPAIVSLSKSSFDPEDQQSQSFSDLRESQDFSEGESPLRLLREMADGMNWKFRSSTTSQQSQKSPQDAKKGQGPSNKKSKFRSLFNDMSFLDQIEELEQKLAGAISLGSQIGAGSFGRVFRARNQDSGQFLAVKRLLREINFLQKLKHEHIVQYQGCFIRDQGLHICMEYMDDSVSNMLKKYGPFQEEHIARYTHQMLKGLQYLHSKHIIHSDLKGANILTDRDGTVKLADFGASRHLDKLSHSSMDTGVLQLNSSIKGTPFWMAPELILGKRYGRKADIWSLGCTIIQMTTGHHPYWPDLKKLEDLEDHIREGKKPRIPANLSESARDLISLCLTVRQEERPRAKTLLRHEFFRNIQDEV